MKAGPADEHLFFQCVERDVFRAFLPETRDRNGYRLRGDCCDGFFVAKDQRVALSQVVRAGIFKHAEVATRHEDRLVRRDFVPM
jgi:hypothetical protein